MDLPVQENPLKIHQLNPLQGAAAKNGHPELRVDLPKPAAGISSSYNVCLLHLGYYNSIS